MKKWKLFLAVKFFEREKGTTPDTTKLRAGGERQLRNRLWYPPYIKSRERRQQCVALIMPARSYVCI